MVLSQSIKAVFIDIINPVTGSDHIFTGGRVCHFLGLELSVRTFHFLGKKFQIGISTKIK